MCRINQEHCQYAMAVCEWESGASNSEARFDNDIAGHVVAGHFVAGNTADQDLRSHTVEQGVVVGNVEKCSNMAVSGQMTYFHIDGEELDTRIAAEEQFDMYVVEQESEKNIAGQEFAGISDEQQVGEFHYSSGHDCCFWTNLLAVDAFQASNLVRSSSYSWLDLAKFPE